MKENIIYPINPILIIDTDQSFIKKVEETLKANNISHIKVCSDDNDLNRQAKIEQYSLILLTISSSSERGKEMALRLLEEYPKIPIILISNDDSVNDAIRFMSQGALYYFVKSNIEYSKLVVQIRRGIQLYESIKPIITRSKKMRTIFRDISRIAPTNANIFLRGETGVGKELVANSIHVMSKRPGQFVPINIVSFDKTLFADAIFGHVRGAFDGARGERNGFIEKAGGGTLYMDEIGDLDSDSQLKLLRFLKDGHYQKIGSDNDITSNARIIVATNKNIEEEIRKGNYRSDFFERIKAFTITIPPLRERKEDIPLLVCHFIRKVSAKLNVTIPKPDDEFIQALMHRDYIGNIRELEGLVERIMVQFADCEKLTLEMLEGYNTDVSDSSIVTKTIPSIYSTENTDKPDFYLPSFIEIEASYYQELLIRTNGNQSKAAIIARLETRSFNTRLHSIKEKLKKEYGTDFNDVPPLSELVKRFPPRNGKVG